MAVGFQLRYCDDNDNNEDDDDSNDNDDDDDDHGGNVSVDDGVDRGGKRHLMEIWW